MFNQLDIKITKNQLKIICHTKDITSANWSDKHLPLSSPKPNTSKSTKPKYNN